MILKRLLIFIVLLVPMSCNRTSTTDYTDEVKARIQKVEESLGGNIRIEGSPDWTIQERMEFHKIPGLTIGVISNFELEWVKGYGMANKENNVPVTPTTLFQAASISKSLNAVGVLKLVQDKKIDLNEDINTYLSQWKFPYDTVAKGKPITVYHLLTHTAGLTVHGFPGYGIGDTLPTVPEILDGRKPANTAAVRSAMAPGIRFQYSGGGTTITQQIVTDIQPKSYDQYMQEVLDKLGMKSSFYTVPPAERRQKDLATAYSFDGSAKKSRYHLYPEQAAASLWTNPADLAQYIIETQQAYLGRSSKVLNQEMTKLRLTPFEGSDAALGVFISKKGESEYFEHGGANEGFRCQYVGSLDGVGNGVVVMVNSDNGAIIQELINAVAVVYEWKGYYSPQLRKLASVPDDVLSAYEGKYELGPDFILTITKDGSSLKVEPTGQGVHDLYAESPTSFFLLDVDAKLEFVRKESGGVEKLILHQNGRTTDARRLP